MSRDASTSPLRPAPVAAAAHSGEPRWQVRLLGAVEAFDGVQRVERFPSRAAAALLARLALAPERAHSREELIELLWPGVALDVGRNRLRQTLSTLKSLLEAPGVPGAAVLLADRMTLRVVRGALGCDALTFERLARAGRAAEALALYGGELMPGFYDEWIADERQRLAALHGGLPVSAAPSQAAAQKTAETAPVAGPAAAPFPTYLTRLFGADMAAARLRALVLSRRLVTLLGPGGSGKTRLGVEVAQALRQHGALWPAGSTEYSTAALPFERIAFVSLVACEDAPQMQAAIARALQLTGGSAAGGDGVARLVAALSGQRVLLVLDNFEQLVGRAESALAELLARLPALHLLVTSRRALGLDGEQAVNAEPLAVPADAAPLAAAAANPAVALFVDRARAVRADFHLGERNHAAVVALVRALHGMPLAIELAASRVRSFPPAEMVALLTAGESGHGHGQGAHLALLVRGGPRSGHDARHASMAQVIDWSWRLLAPREQRALGALTLFAGAASAAGMAAVLGESLAATAALLDDLVAHTLVRVEAQAEGATRFGLVEPVREFVAAQLTPESAAELRGRLRRWLIDWARALGPAAAPARVAPELASVHAALAAGSEGPAAAHDAVELALALRAYWDTDGLPGRIQSALEQALAALPEAALRAEMHELLSYLRFEGGDAARARAHAEAALVAAGDHPSLRARALVRRAWVEIAGGRAEDDAGPGHPQVQAWLQEALALARGSSDRDAQARALHQLAVLTSHLHHDTPRAEAMFAESQALWLALGDRRKANARLRNRAQCWVQMGRADEALACYQSCEQQAREDGDWVGQIDSQISLAALLGDRRQWQAALDVNRRCVALAWQRWHRHGLAYALWNPPRLLARLRRPEPAIRLMAFASNFWTEGFGALGRADLQYVKRVRALAQAQLGTARTQALWQEGAAMDVGAAVALAMLA